MNTNLLDIDHKKNIYLKYKRLYVVSLLGSLVLQFGTEQQNNLKQIWWVCVVIIKPAPKFNFSLGYTRVVYGIVW